MSLLLSEALKYKDLEGMLKPTIHVDEFASKMGDDDDIIVLSFFVRSKEAAKDLISWFEKGYDFVMDADCSPGEISPGRFLVYVELRRRTHVPEHIEQMLDDLASLTEFEPNDWNMDYERKEYPWSKETFAELVPLSPARYRRQKETGLNEMRVAAGIPPVQIYKPTRELRQLQAAAGI